MCVRPARGIDREIDGRTVAIVRAGASVGMLMVIRGINRTRRLAGSHEAW